MFATTKEEAEKAYSIAIAHYNKAEFDRVLESVLAEYTSGEASYVSVYYSKWELYELAIERTKLLLRGDK